jgi:hypothetical protein
MTQTRREKFDPGKSDELIPWPLCHPSMNVRLLKRSTSQVSEDYQSTGRAAAWKIEQNDFENPINWNETFHACLRK